MYRSTVDTVRAQRANRMLWGLFLLLLAVTIAALCFFYVFLIRHIEFVGNERFAADELTQMTGLVYEESMLLINRQAVTENLQKNPYLAVEQIELQFPSTVRITVRERSGCALTQQLGNVLLLDSEGVVLSVDASILQNEMCAVEGWNVLSSRAGETIEVEQSMQLAAYAAAARELERFDLLGSVRQIDVENPLGIVLTMRDGMLVKLGDTTEMTMKITWLSKMLDELKDEGYSGGTLDLTSGKSASYLPDETE